MSAYDAFMSNTVGLLYRAGSGTVDPWTLANMKEETATGIAKASGPQATPGQIERATSSALSQMEDYLRSIGAHPDQAGQGLSSSLKKALGWIVAILILIAFAWGAGGATARRAAR